MGTCKTKDIQVDLGIFPHILAYSGNITINLGNINLQYLLFTFSTLRNEYHKIPLILWNAFLAPEQIKFEWWIILSSVCHFQSNKKWCFKNFYSIKKSMMLGIVDKKAFTTFFLVQKGNIIYSFLFFMILKGHFSIFDSLFQ